MSTRRVVVDNDVVMSLNERFGSIQKSKKEPAAKRPIARVISQPINAGINKRSSINNKRAPVLRRAATFPGSLRTSTTKQRNPIQENGTFLKNRFSAPRSKIPFKKNTRNPGQNQFSREKPIKGIRGRGNNINKGKPGKKITKEKLDRELNGYMFKEKAIGSSLLDTELDEYMSAGRDK